MRKHRRLLTAAAAAAALFVSSVMTGFAAEDYTYTVTFYAGNQGSFSGTEGLSVDGAAEIQNEGSRIVVSGLASGTVVSFDDLQGSVELADSGKYYVQGVRESGRDNDEMGPTVIRVNEDADYVVAYGIQGNMTGYTVSYEDAQGNELAPSRTYYGNVGDKPVVAYLYIEDFVPRTLGLTKTLSENEAENQFTFIYDPVETEVIVEPGETTTITETRPGEAQPGGAQTGDEPGAADEPGAVDEPGAEVPDADEPGADGPGAADDETQPGETSQIDDEEVPLGEQDITDLDDEEVPLANLPGDGDSESETLAKAMPLVIGGGIVAAAAVILVSMGIIIIKRRGH